MMWPWQRQRLAVEQVHQEVEQAAAEKTAAQKRRERAMQLAAESRKSDERVYREIALNGFTELLRQAMGGR